MVACRGMDSTEVVNGIACVTRVAPKAFHPCLGLISYSDILYVHFAFFFFSLSNCYTGIYVRNANIWLLFSCVPCSNVHNVVLAVLNLHPLCVKQGLHGIL